MLKHFKSPNARNLFRRLVAISLYAWCLVVNAPAFADDIDVYYPEVNVSPNVMFVVDASGSMGWTDGTNLTRMQRIRAALEIVLTEMQGVKVGLTQFRSGNQATVLLPISPLESDELNGGNTTHRQAMKSAIRQIPTAGSTPTVAGLYEAALYFAGEPVSSVTPTANGVLRSGSAQPTYQPPSFDGCDSRSFIVLMTDGQPTTRVNTNKISNRLNRTCSSSNNPSFGRLEDYLACGREVVDSLANGDFISGQPVYLFTVGLGIQNGDAWLKHFADRGRHPDITGENFFSLSGAASVEELTEAIKDIVRQITELDIQSVAQPVPASNFQGIANKGELYLGVYEVGAGEYWQGNVHKYRLGADAVIYGKDSSEAVGDDGFFTEEAQGFWSSAPDGGSPEVGGARENLSTASQRKIYTHLASANSDDLTNIKNNFHADNVKTGGDNSGLLTPELFGVGNSARVAELVDWVRDGKLMDPLHTTVQLVTYDQNDEEDTSYVFYGDNGGFFRVLSADTGKEIFSFMPEQLLKNLDVINTNALGERTVYGVDGPISLSIKDNFGARGVIDKDDIGADSVTAYFGLRRGSEVGYYYALDVTKVDEPKVLWIKSAEDSDTRFKSMGQSWSRLTETKTVVEGAVTPVLLFGGGYDSDKDEQTSREADDKGNAVYMINALTGQYIWSAGSAVHHTETISSMQYSIPGSIRLIDLDKDGILDRFYFGDTGGQLWRCLVHGGNDLDNLVDCAVLLKVAGDNAEDDRRFFEMPDVSRATVGGVKKLAIGIGSGNRANLKDINVDEDLRDQFYVVFDSAQKGVPGPTNLDQSKLFDASTALYDANSATEEDKEKIKIGWFMTLRKGEKVLSTATTYEEKLLFSTYKYLSDSDQCNAGEGDSRLYVVTKVTADPVNQAGETPQLSDRYTELDTKAVVVSPVVYSVAREGGVLPESNDQACVGLECFPLIDGGGVDVRHFQSDH
jgi:type IV pilus assembly protein PilY1